MARLRLLLVHVGVLLKGWLGCSDRPRCRSVERVREVRANVVHFEQRGVTQGCANTRIHIQ